MIIWWNIDRNDAVDYPDEGDVLEGIEYANGDRVGTLAQTIQAWAIATTDTVTVEVGEA